MGNISPTLTGGWVCPLHRHPAEAWQVTYPKGTPARYGSPSASAGCAPSPANSAEPRADPPVCLWVSRASAERTSAHRAYNATSRLPEGKRVLAAQTRDQTLHLASGCGGVACVLPSPRRKGPTQLSLGKGAAPEAASRADVPTPPGAPQGRAWGPRPGRRGTEGRGAGAAAGPTGPAPPAGGAARDRAVAPPRREGKEGEEKQEVPSPPARPPSPSMFSRSLMCCRLQPVSSRLSSASGR